MEQQRITGAQLKEIAYRRGITSWTAFECPVCDYPIKYVFARSNPEVLHDPGCYCTEETHRQRYESSSWDLLADYINKVTDLEQIKRIKQFWKL